MGRNLGGGVGLGEKPEGEKMRETCFPLPFFLPHPLLQLSKSKLTFYNLFSSANFPL